MHICIKWTVEVHKMKEFELGLQQKNSSSGISARAFPQSLKVLSQKRSGSSHGPRAGRRVVEENESQTSTSSSSSSPRG